MVAFDPAPLRPRLLAWYRQHRRDLPWRRTRDPYAVWLSEIMLQQTRVDTVIPYFERFLARWPTLAALAAADPEEVRAAWSGLGYYRRCRAMLEAARVVASEHGGRLPETPEALRRLPGFGRYTAGAVSSIAFGVPAPAVDGNVARVLARVLALRDDPTRGAGERAVWAAAAALAPGEAPEELTQALIELGALVCTPKRPSCAACPLEGACGARREGLEAVIPPPRRRPARSRAELTALLSFDGTGVLLERQPEEGLFGGLWCLPMVEGHLEGSAAADEAARKYGWELHTTEPVAEVLHVLTHRDLAVRVLRVDDRLDERLDERDDRPTPALPSRQRVPLEGLSALGLPTFTARTLRAALPRAALGRAVLPGRTTRARGRGERLELVK